MIPPSNDDWLTAINESPTLSIQSKKSYVKHARALITASRELGPHSLSTVLFNMDTVLPRLANLPTHKLRSHLILILALFKRGEERRMFKRSDAHVTRHHRNWMEQLFKVNTKHRARLEENLPSDRELEAAASLQDWVNAHEQMQTVAPGSKDALLVAFHALALPPLRGGDLSHVRIGEHMSGNCIYIDREERSLKNPNGVGVLVIREHKTAHSYPELRRELPPELVELVLSSLKKEPRDWLFTAKSGAAFSDSGFSTWKGRVFRAAFKGRPVTTNSLRHAFISETDRQHQSIKDARSLASAMGHSLQVQRQYVRLR